MLIRIIQPGILPKSKNAGTVVSVPGRGEQRLTRAQTGLGSAVTRSRLLPALLFALAAGPGCRQADPFPIDRDSRWEMLFLTREISGSETVEVRREPGLMHVTAERTDSAFGHYFVVEITRGERHLYTLLFQKRRAGTFLLLPWLVADRVTASDEWIQLVAARLRPGQAWYGNAYHDQLFEVVAREVLTVPLGRVPGCYRLAVHTDKEAWPAHLWFAPGLGPVKWEFRTIRTRDGRRWERCETAELVRRGPGPDRP
jgi:hypothetical protein